MPSYTLEARKAQYLAYREMGLKNTPTAEKAGFNQITRHSIWAQAGQLKVTYSVQGLLAPTIEELVAVKRRN
jgi:hypothetical protein